MAYTVEHKVGKYIYICRITSYWDKEKKQPRQHREYIGRKDPKTGKVIPYRSRYTPVMCKHYGATFLLYNICQSIGLTEILKEIFPHEWDQILACSFYGIIEKRPLYLCQQWAEITHLGIDTSCLASQRISELLQSVGNQSGSMLKFSKAWAKQREEKEYIVFDITSISSYAELIEFVEYGYNRDKENLPQINLGMLFGYTSMLPIFYTVYPGSVKDVSTIKNMIAFVEDLELRNVIYVFDKGFYSECNISEMVKNKWKFLISVPFTVAAARELVRKYGNEIGKMANSFVVNNNVGYGIITKTTIGNKRLTTYLYIDKRKKLQAEEEIIRHLKEIETELAHMKNKRLRAIEKYFDQHYKGWRDICFIRRKGKQYVFGQHEKGIAEVLAYKGCIIIVSNSSMKAKEAISLYRDKDIVEKAFDNLKNELDSKRLRVHSTVSMQGRLFISFISLIIYSVINKVMKENNLYQSYTFDEVIRELNKISVVSLAKKIIFTEVTKKQKELLKLFELELQIPSGSFPP